jgi:formylmethanofuran dehydrogenase subunit E
MELQPLLDLSACSHSSLCPRQILGARMGLYGIKLLNLPPGNSGKRLLIIAETDGCFVDGISAATNCTVGHRTLRVEDYGKVAATFADTHTGREVRISPALDVRKHAWLYSPTAQNGYLAQMQAYQIMPDEEMFTAQTVKLNINLAQIISQPGKRVNCRQCGEEIMNEREVRQNGLTLCLPCARGGYYSVERSIRLSYIPQNEYALSD